jgi:Na+/proline symporter
MSQLYVVVLALIVVVLLSVAAYRTFQVKTRADHRARKLVQFTLPDLLEARYSQTAHVLGTIAIPFAYAGITCYQIKGGGNVHRLIFPKEPL